QAPDDRAPARRGARCPQALRRGEGPSVSQCGPRDPPRPGGRHERATPGRAAHRGHLDHGSAHRRGDSAGVRARCGGRGPMTAGVRVWARRYGALMRNAWMVDLQYRASIVLWIMWGVMEPAIALGIWWSIAGQGSVGGYTRTDFARYFFALTLINQLTIAWDSCYLDRWIREGDLNFKLPRPVHPVHEAIADNIAYKARSAGTLLLIWLGVSLVWSVVRLPFAPTTILITALAVVLAAVLRFLISFTTGLLAFWTTRATSIMELHAGISLFLAGRIAPLSLLPPVVAGVA